MKSLSCTSTPKVDEDPPDRPCIPIDEDKDNTKPTALGHDKGPKIQTLIEVLRCELGRPGRSSTAAVDNGLGPRKQWSPLYYAVFHNREAALLHFLRAGHSPDGVAGIGQPPLCVATAAGHIEIIKILCEAGANVKASTKHLGETALHLAIKTGRNDILNFLLPYGPDLNARALFTGETPLHYAAAKAGSLATVVALLKGGANYEAVNSEGCTPAEVALQAHNLHAAVAIVGAARGKQRKLVKEKEMLLKHVEKGQNGQNRFSMNNELIADIFEASCPLDSTVLVEAIKRDDAGLVEMFLEQGADPNRVTSSGVYPIFVALNCSGAQVVHALVTHGADVTLRDPHGLTVLQAALESPLAHDKEAMSGIVEALLSSGADPKVRYPDGTTLLHKTVEQGIGLARVAQLLLQHGVNVNERDQFGNTALHIAFHSRSCIAALLKHGGDANIPNNDGLTPLLYAAKNATGEREPDLDQLIKATDTRNVDSAGRTALHLAAQSGLEKTVRLLLQARMDTTSVDGKNRTPLLLAVLNHQWAVIPFLAIQPGINSWDEDGLTALHHIAMTTPKGPATWKDMAAAATTFCEKGVSRSLRDRSGATPLIQAVKTLPEEGLLIVEILLQQKGSERSNCVGHEDHKQRNALYYAATLGKPKFVELLLRKGSPFALKDWRPKKAVLRPDNAVDKQILRLFAEHEWLRRAGMLHRQSGVASEEPMLPKILPLSDLEDLLAMGLDPNALLKAKQSSPLLWIILNQLLASPPLPQQYLHDILNLVLSLGADPNAVATRHPHRTSSMRNSQPVGPTLHPLTFLIEQHPSIDIDIINLFLSNGARLSIASSFYGNRFPLHSAVHANRIDLVDEFLTQKADTNVVDNKGRTPLFIAGEKGYWEILDLLLRFGANVDVKDEGGDTALHVAATGGNKRVVSCLLRAGAKAGEQNSQGVTPLGSVPETLIETEKEKIVGMLQRAEEQEQRETARKERERLARQSQLFQQKAKLVPVISSQPVKPALSPITNKVANRSSTIEPLRHQSRPKGKETQKRHTVQIDKEKTWLRPQSLIRKASISNVNKPKTKPLVPAPLAISKPLNKPLPKPKPSPPTEPSRTTPLPVSKQQVVSIRYTPPSPNPAQKASEKPLPQPRADSGINLQQTARVDKPLPELNRNRTTFDGKAERADQGEELASWLEISRMLDRL